MPSRFAAAAVLALVLWPRSVPAVEEPLGAHTQHAPKTILIDNDHLEPSSVDMSAQDAVLFENHSTRPIAVTFTEPADLRDRIRCGLILGSGEERATALSAVRGEAPALVAFSASYCPPCRAEVPVLRRASSRWKREGVRVIAIAVDVGDAAEAAAVARDWGIDYDLYWLADDARDDARRLAPAGLPVTFFVGRAGVSRLDRLLTDEDVDRLVHGDLAPHELLVELDGQLDQRALLDRVLHREQRGQRDAFLQVIAHPLEPVPARRLLLVVAGHRLVEPGVGLMQPARMHVLEE